MAKMCKYFYSKEREYENCNKYHKCPEDTNAKCEIIPPKRKVKRFKAWAYVDDGKIVWTQRINGIGFVVPCIIEIQEKYLRGE